MSTDTNSETTRSGRISPIVWSLLLLLACYVLLFAALCLDSFVLNHQYIEEPIRRISPEFSDRFGEFLRIIYWPEIQVMKMMKIIPS
jgi:hypothetical protein